MCGSCDTTMISFSQESFANRSWCSYTVIVRLFSPSPSSWERAICRVVRWHGLDGASEGLGRATGPGAAVVLASQPRRSRKSSGADGRRPHVCRHSLQPTTPVTHLLIPKHLLFDCDLQQNLVDLARRVDLCDHLHRSAMNGSTCEPSPPGDQRHLIQDLPKALQVPAGGS